MVYIYCLIDPSTKEIKYVGKSKNPTNRLKSHISDSIKGIDNTRKSNWIRKLNKEGLLPELVILEETNEVNWKEAEKKWILFYRNKYDLCNHTDGGDGVQNPDYESRQKLSRKRIELFKNPEFKAKCDKVAKSPERRRKISEALKGRSKSSEHVAKIRQLPQNNKGRKLTLEHIEKIKNAGKGHRWSLEEIEAIRKLNLGNKYGIGNMSRKGQTQSEEEKLKKSITQRDKQKSQEHKRKISEGAKRAWAEKRSKENWGSFKRIDWSFFKLEEIENELKTKTLTQTAKKYGISSASLSNKLYKERQKGNKNAQI